MKKSTIISQKTKKRYPILSFTLSFFFCGMGQVYNAELLKGIVFFFLRTLPLLILILQAVWNSDKSLINIFIFLTTLSALMTILASLEAYGRAHKAKNIVQKIYNSWVTYVILIICNILFTFTLLYNLSIIFEISKANADNYSPFFSRGDIILINSYPRKTYDKNDSLLFKNNHYGTIIANEGDIIRTNNNKLMINDRHISIIIIKNFFQDDSSQYIFTSDAEPENYPLFHIDIAIPETMLNTPLLKNQYVVAQSQDREDFTLSLITKDQIQGILEGRLINMTKINNIFEKIYK